MERSSALSPVVVEGVVVVVVVHVLLRVRRLAWMLVLRVFPVSGGFSRLLSSGVQISSEMENR